jgi:hypothetical protein
MPNLKPTARGPGARTAQPAEVASQLASTKGPTKTSAYTQGIEFLAVGVSEKGGKFLLVAKDGKHVVLSVRNLGRDPSAELERLEALDVHLLVPQARNAFLHLAQEAARKEPTFPVVAKTGWRGSDFVLPEGLAPRGPAKVERYFDPRYAQYHRRLHRAGTIQGWLQLAALCRGKTRLIAGLCLAFTGPVCGQFGDEPPGLQLVCAGGLGKTTVGRVAATVWGGDGDPARRLGCGISWNTTNLDLEIVAAALDQMLLFLDDMHRASKQDVEKIIELMNGEGRGRWTEAQRASFCVPVFSTSNTSVVSIARDLKMMNQIEALIDRLTDIPLPARCPYMCEGIRTPAELRAFGDRLRQLSRSNFGSAGPEFVRRLELEIRANRASVSAFVDARRRTYRDASDRLRSLGGRDLTRISDKFATAYVAGCLAIRYKILPFTEAEILAALLTCERDHVAFIDRELGLVPARATSAPGTPLAQAPQSAIAGAVVPAQRPFDRLCRYIARNRSLRFIRLRSRFSNFFYHLRRSKGARVDVYIGEHKGQGELWFPSGLFERVAGGAREAAALKRELFTRGILVTEQRGAGVSYVVKRPLPDGSRPFFVVLRSPSSRELGRALARP